MQFAAGLVRYWAFNIAAWAAAIGGVAYFLGYIEEAETFFRTYRTGMVAALLLHFALCAIIYDASHTRRIAGQVIKELGRAK
jgi:phosphoglycerol transferase MdoB-like AlkP superfamily enzyme